MSDGASEGYRWARENEARQKKVDEFFGEVMRVIREKAPVGELKPEFETFDAIRYANHIARGRLERTKNARWSAFRKTLSRAIEEDEERQPWAEILALALRYASMNIVKILQAVARPFASANIALFMPNGPGREPTLCGDFKAVLDAAATGRRKTVVIKIDDPERAVVGVIIGGGETTEPERAQLRFIAVIP